MRLTEPLCAAGIALLLAAGPNEAAGPATSQWPVGTPGSVGLDPAPLAELDADIRAGKFANVDSMLVIRRGTVVYDRAYRRDYGGPRAGGAAGPHPFILHDPSGPYNYLNPWWHPYYRGGDLHTMQSATKSVMAATIGVALARNEFPALDTPILRFFDDREVANVDARKRRMTIRDLLTMTAGIEWQEDLPFSDPRNSAHVMEASCDWVRYTIDLPMQYEPGRVFHYSSGVSQLLSHVFQRATGHDIEEYASQHLFAPLGISDFFWKRTPTGLANTEGGLYLRPLDLAKIGYLYLKDGVWNGRRILGAEWVRLSTTPSATVSESTGEKYGFQWWLLPYGDNSRLAWAALGWGGQLLIVVPEHELVLVFTGWNINEEPTRLRPSVAIERVVRALK